MASGGKISNSILKVDDFLQCSKLVKTLRLLRSRVPIISVDLNKCVGGYFFFFNLLGEIKINVRKDFFVH